VKLPFIHFHVTLLAFRVILLAICEEKKATRKIGIKKEEQYETSHSTTTREKTNNETNLLGEQMNETAI
jgi:hypothetical protein